MHPDLYQEFDVPENLTPFVRRIIYCDCESPIELNLPATPTVYNYFSWIVHGNWEAVGSLNSTELTSGRVSLVGQIYRRKIRVVAGGRFRHVAAELTAAGLTSLFGEYPKNYQNQVVEITPQHAAYSSHVQRMNNGAWHEKPVQASINLLVTALSYYSQTTHKVPFYVLDGSAQAERVCGNLTVEQMSGTQNVEFFSKQFSKYIGIPPKYFAQVIRVNTTLLALTKANPTQLAKVAHDCGYFDESHLIKEVRLFFNSSPSDLRENIDVILKTFPMGSQLIGENK